MSKRNKNVEKDKTGIEKFETLLYPKVVAEIKGWTKQPELSKIYRRFELITMTAI